MDRKTAWNGITRKVTEGAQKLDVNMIMFAAVIEHGSPAFIGTMQGDHDAITAAIAERIIADPDIKEIMINAMMIAGVIE